MVRLDWIVSQGYTLTDITDAAITAYLDSVGVPRPDADGHMPDSSPEGDR